MKQTSIEKQTDKGPMKLQSSGGVGSVFQEITARFPSMTTDEAWTCALNVCSQNTKKKGVKIDFDKLSRIAATTLAENIVIKNGGPIYTEGRIGAMAQLLLKKWGVPNNSIEVARFLKMLNQGRTAWENLDKLLTEPIKK